MGSWVNYWRIVKPEKKALLPTVLKTDSDYTGMGAEVSAMQWYNQIMRGIGSRTAKYKQFDLMDADTDVARALDTIAEEIASEDKKTNLPFIIEYQTEDSQEVNENVITTIRAAIRHWSNLQDLKNRIFSIARTTIKYGDCFFQRTNPYKPWEYIDPSTVIGIEINQKGEKVAYHISKMSSVTSMNGQKQQHIEVIPAEHIIHFSLTDLMGPAAPFGDSILLCVLKTYKQLTMLEDSVVIYRIVRAPERRVFYIDVGNMPAQRVKQYLEQVKNDVRQKRMPNTNGTETVDGTYNPNCFDMSTRVPLLDGRTLSIMELTEEHKNGKVNWAYSCDPETGKVVPGIITWAGVTRKNAETIKLTLDNNSEIICTPDHKFPVFGKGFVEAKNITPNDSLIPFITRDNVLYGNSDYQQVYDNATKEWKYTHRISAEFMREHKSHLEYVYSDKFLANEKNVVHHLDYNRKNNCPSNLVFMSPQDHNLFHRETKQQWWNNLSKETREQVIKAISEGTKIGMAKIPEDIRKEQIEKAVERLRAYHYSNKLNPTIEYSKWKDDTISRVRKWSLDPIIIASRKLNGQINCNLPLNQELSVSQDMFSRAIKLINEQNLNRIETLQILGNDEEFMKYYREANIKKSRLFKISFDKISDKLLNKLYKFIGSENWKQFKNDIQLYNHKIIKIEKVENRDVGTITIDGKETFHNYHTFAIENGIFVKNSIQEDYYFPVTSAGRGSRVETLPGGENLGENSDIKYFQDKIFRGLRIPSSYMRGSDAAGAQVADGKVGIAYIEELRFANFIKRLQSKIEIILDKEFKTYMNASSIKVDDELFMLKLPDPQNFALYRQAALDSELINTYNSAEQIKYLSRRFILKRYLGFTEDDLQMNEIMLKQERGIQDDRSVDDLQQIYSPNYYENPEKIDELNAAAAEEAEEAPDEGSPDAEGGGDLGDLETGSKEEAPPEEKEAPPEGE